MKPELGDDSLGRPAPEPADAAGKRRAEAERRAAQVTLADLTLRLAGGDKDTLRDVLEACGFIPYTPGSTA